MIIVMMYYLQATQQLKQVVKDPQIIPALCTILGSSQDPQVRKCPLVQSFNIDRGHL